MGEEHEIYQNENGRLLGMWDVCKLFHYKDRSSTFFVCQEINPWVKGWTGDGSHVLFGGNQFSSFFNLLGFWFFVET